MRVVGPPHDRMGTSRGIKNLMHGTSGLINSWTTIVSKLWSAKYLSEFRKIATACCFGTEEVEAEG